MRVIHLQPSDVARTLKSLKRSLRRGEVNVPKLIFDQLNSEVSEILNRTWPPATRREAIQVMRYQNAARLLMREAFPGYYL
jgi:hypothetical protein